MHTTFVKSRTTAQDVMTANPASIHERATLLEASAFLTAKRISAAPVINDAGRPVGVLSGTDIVRHASRVCRMPSAISDFYKTDQRIVDDDARSQLQTCTVHEAMTPTVFAVALDSPLPNVVEELLNRKVHRLFVIDAHGVLVGVISAINILRNLPRKAFR